MAHIFISYRESDAPFAPVLVRGYLVDAFGQDNVFLDKDNLRSGSWSDQLDLAVRGCRVFVLLIGGQWLSAANNDGTLRLTQEHDVHRREITLALAQPDVRVIPIYTEGTPILQESQLPAELHALTRLQGFQLSPNAARRAADMARLVSEVEQVTGLRARRTGGIPFGLYLKLSYWVPLLFKLFFFAFILTLSAGIFARYTVGPLDTTVRAGIFVALCAGMLVVVSLRNRALSSKKS